MYPALLGIILASSSLVSDGLYAATCPADTPQQCASAPSGCIARNDLCILEPIPGSGLISIAASDIGNLGAFLRYVNGGVWQWAFGMGIGIAVLNGTFGGLTIVLSNGDSSKIEAGKTRFLWSAIGLIILFLSGVILNFINPVGFTNL